MSVYIQFREMKINHGVIGLEQRDSDELYDCTPKGAEIIGWAGVDGIHYCTVPELGETVFAVSPMNFDACIHPVARNFRDLLCLLLTCGSADILEQCHAWNEEQFRTAMTTAPVTPEQQSVLDAIREEFHLEPIEQVLSYVKTLQEEMDLSQIPGMQGDALDGDTTESVPWSVTFEGGFWSTDGNPGKILSLSKIFRWGGETWYIPAGYLCDEGLVLDFLMEVEPDRVRRFIEKWNFDQDDHCSDTPEQQEQIQREHPLNVDFNGWVKLNGEKLRCDRGFGVTWMPDSCQSEDYFCDTEAKDILNHYGLSLDSAWAIHRKCYPWGTTDSSKIQMLTVRMERKPEKISGLHFQTPEPGTSLVLEHPLTGKCYTMTIHQVEQREVPASAFFNPNLEYPTHYLAMEYSVEPDIGGRKLLIQDCAESDRLGRKKAGMDAPEPGAASVGIIGGEDGPTVIFMGGNPSGYCSASSSLHHEPVQQVEWRAVFREKPTEDMEVKLL